MNRGMISNIAQPIFWIMHDVLFKDGKIRDDRLDWFDRASYLIDIVVILPPKHTLMDHPYDVSYKSFRSLTDAQRALKQDPRPVCIISENTDSIADETWSFHDNILSRYNLGRKTR